MGSSSNRYAPRLPQQETKSSTKQLAPTDPILGPENLLKTSFAQKGLPSCPSGRHKPQSSLLPKLCASATLIQKLQKMNLNTVPKMGTAWRSHFWGPHAQLSKRTKRKALSRSQLWDRQAVPKMRPQNRKIHSKGRPLQQTKKLQLHLFKQPAYRFGTEEARTCEA